MEHESDLMLVVEFYLQDSHRTGGLFEIRPRVAHFTRETISQIVSHLQEEFYPIVVGGDLGHIRLTLEHLQQTFGEEADVCLDLNLDYYGVRAVRSWIREPTTLRVSIWQYQEGACHQEHYGLEDSLFTALHRVGLLSS